MMWKNVVMIYGNINNTRCRKTERRELATKAQTISGRGQRLIRSLLVTFDILCRVKSVHSHLFLYVALSLQLTE